MKKKLIASLIAGAVLSTGIIGLTACGGGHDINKGEQVDEAGWKAAITATGEAKNYTVKAYEEAEMKTTGNMELLGLTDINITTKESAEANYYFDLGNGSIYSKETIKMTVSGVPDKLKDEDVYKNKEYSNEAYSVKDGDTYYSARYRGSDKEPEWNVNESSSFYGGGFGYLVTNASYATEKNGTSIALSELYESFTYSNGVYTATLWDHDTEETVSLSIKGGYVVGYSFSSNYEGGSDSLKVTGTGKTVYNFSDYGSTTVKASDDAKKAVEDYKAE